MMIDYENMVGDKRSMSLNIYYFQRLITTALMEVMHEVIDENDK